MTKINSNNDRAASYFEVSSRFSYSHMLDDIVAEIDLDHLFSPSGRWLLLLFYHGLH